MKNERIIITAIVSVSLIICSFFFSNAYKYKFKSTQTIDVTGLAKKDFESDLVKWGSVYSRKDKDLKSASAALNRDREIVRTFLLNKGIKPTEITFGAISIDKDFEHRRDANDNNISVFNGYVLSQYVSIESKDLNLVETVSREITNLISEGIELNSSAPSFYYSGLENLKLELIAQATKNARQRAENIAKESDSSLGELINAYMGVFQITGQNDEEDYSSGGIFNTSSRKKTANITVKLSFRSN